MLIDFTNTNMETLPPSNKVVEYTDLNNPGFCLKVSKTGYKTWLYRYKEQGFVRRYKLGALPWMPKDVAHIAYRKAKEMQKQGIDPKGYHPIIAQAKFVLNEMYNSYYLYGQLKGNLNNGISLNQFQLHYRVSIRALILLISKKYLLLYQQKFVKPNESVILTKPWSQNLNDSIIY